MVFCGVLELCYWSGDDHREAVCGPRLLLVFLHRMSWFLIVGAPRFPRGRPTGGATQPAAHSLGKPANSFRFASCISAAACVSFLACACLSNCAIVHSALRWLATSGKSRRISHGVAYPRYTLFSFPLAFTISSGTPHGR